MTISSLNALIEALRTGAAINKLLVSDAKKDKKIAQILEMCKKQGVPVQRVPRDTIQRKAGPDNQGVFAEIAPVKFYTLKEILDNVKTGLILVLDGITDTGNTGAVIRSAAAAGVDGIIIPQRNAAPINETVLKTSAGTLLKTRIHQAKNLVNTVNELKENNFWVIGADMQGEMAYYDYDFSYKTVIVMGSEDKGIAHLLKKQADHLVKIPHSADVESLNVSAAASIILFEALRQKTSAQAVIS